MKTLNTISLLSILILWSCNSPKVVDQTETATDSESIFVQPEEKKAFETLDPPIPMPGTNPSADVSQVVVTEQLPTSKYLYLKVKNLKTNEAYWIATRQMEVENGAVYFYKGGLLKTNFESKEHNRIFEKIYLVNNLVAAQHGNQASNETTPTISTPKVNVTPVEGSVSIAELVNNPKAYANKTVQITGTCTKINPNIMNRNWVHLKDNSDPNVDFVLTTDQMIPVGHTVTMQGIVSVNKDFGAGYKYDIILENCTLVK